MNGGAYWRALERFAGDVCQKPGVACVSYRDYLARNCAAAAGQHGQRRRLTSSRQPASTASVSSRSM